MCFVGMIFFCILRFWYVLHFFIRLKGTEREKWGFCSYCYIYGLFVERHCIFFYKNLPIQYHYIYYCHGGRYSHFSCSPAYLLISIFRWIQFPVHRPRLLDLAFVRTSTTYFSSVFLSSQNVTTDCIINEKNWYSG